MSVQQAVEVDGDKLMQFVFRAVDEVGATLNAALVVMGDKLGLYRALAGTGGLTPTEPALPGPVSEISTWLTSRPPAWISRWSKPTPAIASPASERSARATSTEHTACRCSRSNH
jgi:hypothetical protein